MKVKETKKSKGKKELKPKIDNHANTKKTIKVKDRLLKQVGGKDQQGGRTTLQKKRENRNETDGHERCRRSNGCHEGYDERRTIIERGSHEGYYTNR